MAIPRPMLLAILGVALIAAVFVTTRGGSQNGTVSSTPAPSVRAAPAHPAAPVEPKVAPRQAPTHRAAPPRPAQPSAGSSKEQAVVNAYNQGEVVVVLFVDGDPQAKLTEGAADAVVDAAAVNSIRHDPGVTVVTADTSDLSGFHQLLPNVPVSQTPAIVVLRSGAQARLIEGMVDATTLAQTIADVQE